MRGSRSTPALSGFGRTTLGRSKMAGFQANNFLPGMSEKTDAPSSQKTDAPAPPASVGMAAHAAASSDQDKPRTAHGAKKRRTDLTFTQMLNLDKATLREFLRGDFLYLKSNSDAVSVYDLHVVDHSEIERDLKSNTYFSYWTMSRAGLTQFFESPADALGPGKSVSFLLLSFTYLLCAPPPPKKKIFATLDIQSHFILQFSANLMTV